MHVHYTLAVLLHAYWRNCLHLGRIPIYCFHSSFSCYWRAHFCGALCLGSACFWDAQSVAELQVIVGAPLSVLCGSVLGTGF